ncbi:hypothetical protein VTH06DRAFT_3802 [Thermothelomyces fergusii]
MRCATTCFNGRMRVVSLDPGRPEEQTRGESRRCIYTESKYRRLLQKKVRQDGTVTRFSDLLQRCNRQKPPTEPRFDHRLGPWSLTYQQLKQRLASERDEPRPDFDDRGPFQAAVPPEPLRRARGLRERDLMRQV